MAKENLCGKTGGKVAASVQLLGQVGIRLCLGNEVILIDPYLSNSVEENIDSRMHRLFPPPISPASLRRVSLILITHEHGDHFDLETLLPVLDKNPEAVVAGPGRVTSRLGQKGICHSRLIEIKKYGLLPIKMRGFRVFSVPASHPEIEFEKNGGPRYTGYVLDGIFGTVYHAGDTTISALLLEALEEFESIDFGFIPVNERNWERETSGVIGNMSIRDAFWLGNTIGLKNFIPTHWDLFSFNGVFREEIELLFEKLAPSFSLILGQSFALPLKKND